MRPISRLVAAISPTQDVKPLKLNQVEELHAHLIRTHLHTDPYSITLVLKSYALSPFRAHKARVVFDQIRRPTLLNFNHLIRGLSQNDRPTEAIDLYSNLMYRRGICGDNLTFISLFKACARVKDVLHGQMFHVRALKLGFGSYLFVSNALIHLYSSLGDLGFALQVFNEMAERDLVSWNSLICGFSQCNMFNEVLGLFRAMSESNVKADAVTMVKVILACSHLSDWVFADYVVDYINVNHVEVDIYLGNTVLDIYGRRGLMDLAQQVFDNMQERNTVSWNAMITGFAKAGNLFAAKELFDQMPEKNAISWSSMITGYAQANQFSDAVNLFQDMMKTNVKPDELTLTSVLSACGHLGIRKFGQTVHDYINEHEIRVDMHLVNALIHMYCNCGAGEKALEIFHEMKEKDNVSWTSIITGLALNGFAGHALEIFSEMLRDGVHPTHGSSVGLLLACTHSGMVDQALEYFGSIEKPDMKHYGCVVELLSRVGELNRAYEFIRRMPVDPDVVIWKRFLSGCKLHRNLDLAEIALNHLLDNDASNSGNSVLASNTYAGLHRLDDDLRRWRNILMCNSLLVGIPLKHVEIV
ncbi:hypothetical protein K2173_008715 [Erythroxylum novogranatense]|uniref:Chlororespiratory reduction 2 n=1 Tax=Erythroxylum novogranatense TaxID=1862640 RepID=A0AAV8SL72_9ROSI|nr:hypothetical protein K2173_008715 [Erythroxylum novogranatense]